MKLRLRLMLCRLSFLVPQLDQHRPVVAPVCNQRHSSLVADASSEIHRVSAPDNSSYRPINNSKNCELRFARWEKTSESSSSDPWSKKISIEFWVSDVTAWQESGAEGSTGELIQRLPELSCRSLVNSYRSQCGALAGRLCGKSYRADGAGKTNESSG